MSPPSCGMSDSSSSLMTMALLRLGCGMVEGWGATVAAVVVVGRVGCSRGLKRLEEAGGEAVEGGVPRLWVVGC